MQCFVIYFAHRLSRIFCIVILPQTCHDGVFTCLWSKCALVSTDLHYEVLRRNVLWITFHPFITCVSIFSLTTDSTLISQCTRSVSTTALSFQTSNLIWFYWQWVCNVVLVFLVINYLKVCVVFVTKKKYYERI